MAKRKVRVDLRIRHFGQEYRLVVDRKAHSQMQRHCDRCDLRGCGLCFWDDEKRIDPDSMTANLFCQDVSEYGRWFGYFKRVKR